MTSGTEGGNGGQFLQYQAKAPEGPELIPEAVRETGRKTIPGTGEQSEGALGTSRVTERSREH